MTLISGYGDPSALQLSLLGCLETCALGRRTGMPGEPVILLKELTGEQRGLAVGVAIGAETDRKTVRGSGEENVRGNDDLCTRFATFVNLGATTGGIAPGTARSPFVLCECSSIL